MVKRSGEEIRGRGRAWEMRINTFVTDLDGIPKWSVISETRDDRRPSHSRRFPSTADYDPRLRAVTARSALKNRRAIIFPFILRPTHPYVGSSRHYITQGCHGRDRLRRPRFPPIWRHALAPGVCGPGPELLRERRAGRGIVNNMENGGGITGDATSRDARRYMHVCVCTFGKDTGKRNTKKETERRERVGDRKGEREGGGGDGGGRRFGIAGFSDWRGMYTVTRVAIFQSGASSEGPWIP